MGLWGVELGLVFAIASCSLIAEPVLALPTGAKGHMGTDEGVSSEQRFSKGFTETL